MKLNINGCDMEVADAMGERKLIAFLRDDLDLTGAKNACDIGACGACTILVDDAPSKICIKRVKDVAGHRVLTIEGMAAGWRPASFATGFCGTWGGPVRLLHTRHDPRGARLPVKGAKCNP